MGIYSPGMPPKTLDFFIKKHKPHYFVETGTHLGASSKMAANLFKEVHTIEFSDHFYQLAKDNLKNHANVHVYHGNSAEKLKQICPTLAQDQFKLFWLDAHWSGGLTYGEGDECPLIDELKTITAYKNSIVLIDDARLFLSPPGLPHDEKQWPKLKDIIEATPEHDLHVFEDVIYITPKNITHDFRLHLQELTCKLDRFDHLRVYFNRLKARF